MAHPEEQGDLPEIFTRAQGGDQLLYPLSLADHLDLPIEDDEEATGQVSLVEDDLTRLVVGPGCLLAPGDVQVDDVTAEQQLQVPVDENLYLPLHPGELEQIVGAV